ncbi:hypothetical protein AB0L00_28140 [Actinoallomurus sp. NPDC052308]|uniref:hypothetical protein n=1 Tax=Actinoallomurus sp. NPDC052308 TaxID=3155530 RepID=UPI0034191496
MSEFRIGAAKARAVLAELTAESAPEPVEPVLRAVPDPAPDEQTTEPAEESPAAADAAPAEVSSQDTTAVDPDTAPAAAPVETPSRTLARWPLILLAVPAFVAVWSGWVGLGELTGFGVVHPLPGIADHFSINSAITLPVGVETYAAYALRAWLAGGLPVRARRFAKWSAIGSLTLGALGQVAYHLLSAAHVTHAPWQITTVVACLPVAVLGMGAALAHLIHDTHPEA